MKEIEKLNEATGLNLFNSRDFISYCRELGLPNEVNYTLLERKISGVGPKGTCVEITLSPYAMILMLQDKAANTEKYAGILNTSIVWLKYPDLLEAAYLANPSDYLTKTGGIFLEFKAFLQEKINTKDNFNIISILPNGHPSLLVYRTCEEKSKLFVIDSVGALIKGKNCLINTINEAFQETELSQDSYTIFFGSATRQNDFYSCPLYTLKDLLCITKYPELLKEIELKADQNPENTSSTYKVFKQFPAHFMKVAQVIMLKDIDGMQSDHFKNEKGTLDEHLAKATGSIEHPHHGKLWIYMETLDTLREKYLDKAYEIIGNYSIEKTIEVFSSMYVDLYNQSTEGLLGEASPTESVSEI